MGGQPLRVNADCGRLQFLGSRRRRSENKSRAQQPGLAIVLRDAARRTGCVSETTSHDNVAIDGAAQRVALWQ
jgi:hypothetical protein